MTSTRSGSATTSTPRRPRHTGSVSGPTRKTQRSADRCRATGRHRSQPGRTRSRHRGHSPTVLECSATPTSGPQQPARNISREGAATSRLLPSCARRLPATGRAAELKVSPIPTNSLHCRSLRPLVHAVPAESVLPTCYQTERTQQNWQRVKSLERAARAPANGGAALSHPGGRRFESVHLSRRCANRRRNPVGGDHRAAVVHADLFDEQA